MEIREAVADTSRNIGGGGRGRNFQHVCLQCPFKICESFKYSIMLGMSNSLFDYCNVTITLYAYILVCFLVPLAPKQHKL